MRLATVVFALMSAVCGQYLSAATITIGFPADPALFNCAPFGCVSNFPINPGTRYQQAYSSSQFPFGPVWITDVTFFPLDLGISTDPFNQYRAGTYALSLSTISAGIDSLSNTTFDANLGSDNTLISTMVLSGPILTNPTFSGGPFFYDPSAGNLLVDLKIITSSMSGGGAPFLARNGTAVGIFSRYDNFGNGHTGFGLVTAFTTTPEPASISLLIMGMLMLGLRRLRGRSFRRTGVSAASLCSRRP